MSVPYLTIGKLERRRATGDMEAISFAPGVNLLVGMPTTGKTKWLQLLDYLLGDPDPFEKNFNEQFVEKYESASVELNIGDEQLLVERRWRQPGVKSKLFVDETEMDGRAFQHLLMEKLGIPLLNYPRGNPLSGQTWPELSFRSLFRHIYRQQRFWTDLADKQQEAELRACLLQFVGLAEKIYTEDYGKLVGLKLEVEKLKGKRESYFSTLNELARDVLSDENLKLTVSSATIEAAEQQIRTEFEVFYRRREKVISSGRDQAVAADQLGRTEELSQDRAGLIVKREHATRLLEETRERRNAMLRYRTDLQEEIGRLDRASDAGAILADLRITHCPACDQVITPAPPELDHCHLCHQVLPDGPALDDLGATRLRFEQERIGGELKEAAQLIDVLEREDRNLTARLNEFTQRLQMIENELRPARQAVSALVQEEVSAIDMAIGEFNERQRQLARLKRALEIGKGLTEQIQNLEKQIEPLQRQVDETARAADFDRAEEFLSDGMNHYLTAIRKQKPGSWRHNPVTVNLSASRVSVKVGSKRWDTALGGTDQLYLLMSYHFGLLSLSDKLRCHYPGLCIIDLPADFLGIDVKDQENFIIQPFIDLLAAKSFRNAQVIITGASFDGLTGVNRQTLREMFVA